MTPIDMGDGTGTLGQGGLRNVSTFIGAIPDSVVSRDADDREIGDSSTKYGVQIETNVEWSEIGGELSGNVAGSPTRAYVYRVSDSTLMGDVDISGLTAGGTFTIDLGTNLVSGETYNFVIDAEGSNYNVGHVNTRDNLPYTSSDGDLSIVDTAINETGTETSFGPANLLRVGNVGFA